MGLTKKIAFDENSMPPKDQIWYRGEGKFYEYKDGKWVLAYDLAGTPSQEELDYIANTIEEKTGKTLEDKSFAEILGAIVDAIPVAAYIDVTDLIETTGIAEITEQQFTQFQNSAGLISRGVYCPKVTALTTEQLDTLQTASGYQINGDFIAFGNFVFGDDGLSSASGLFVFYDSGEKYYIQEFDY